MTITFPKDFLWGTATAAYQIEGAPTADGKGKSIWDVFAHTPHKIHDGTHGDIACDHYHRFEDDIRLMQELGVQAYRFSISWPRIFPSGSGQINEKGFAFYEKVVDRLLEAGIVPFVTLYHWDLPQALEEQGGWYARDTAQHFADYAHAVARKLGDRVKHWITLNEPFVFWSHGYVVGEHAPGHKGLLKSLKAIHNILLAHGKGVSALRAAGDDFSVGLTNALVPVYPVEPGHERAVRRASEFFMRLFMDPVFEKKYPPTIDKLMRLFARNIRPGDMEIIGAPLDFLGVNNYTRMLVKNTLLPLPGFSMEKADYPGVRFTEMGWEIFPQGCLDLMRWIRDTYPKIPVYITESGIACKDFLSDGQVHDAERIRYHKDYLTMLHQAMTDGCDIRGYFVWSFMDNFEWACGKEKRFGLYYVDYDSLQRIAKDSAHWFASVCKTGSLEG